MLIHIKRGRNNQCEENATSVKEIQGEEGAELQVSFNRKGNVHIMEYIFSEHRGYGEIRRGRI